MQNEKIDRIFDIFGEMSSIPHGSGDMEKIANYCVDFAKKLDLKYHRDDANNVIIYKNANKCQGDLSPVILQGHLDMVCQKEEGLDFNFLEEPLKLIYDSDFLKASGTTLGADNGIAVAMILSLLERNDIPHPPIEAVFTTDEEIGMLGAKELDCSLLSGKKFINLDSEEDDTVTVSCAGGSDFKATLKIDREIRTANKVKITLGGLKGGHSGVEIDKHRINANVLGGRFLDYLNRISEIDIISVNGGDKANAIPCLCEIEIATTDQKIEEKINDFYETVAKEISFNEPNFKIEVSVIENVSCPILSKEVTDKLIYILCCIPNGIIDMSSEITGLVETSLNLGILITSDNTIVFHSALRSNKKSSLDFLENKLKLFFKNIDADIETFGHYPPWEYKNDSTLRELYIDIYTAATGTSPKVEAIHAGLECAVFSSAIKNADCIAIGPNIFDAHTVNERLEVSSVEKVYQLLITLLDRLSI